MNDEGQGRQIIINLVEGSHLHLHLEGKDQVKINNNSQTSIDEQQTQQQDGQTGLFPAADAGADPHDDDPTPAGPGGGVPPHQAQQKQQTRQPQQTSLLWSPAYESNLWSMTCEKLMTLNRVRRCDELIRRFPPDRIKEVCIEAVRRRQNLKNPAGWIRRALTDGWNVRPGIAEQVEIESIQTENRVTCTPESLSMSSSMLHNI